MKKRYLLLVAALAVVVSGCGSANEAISSDSTADVEVSVGDDGEIVTQYGTVKLGDYKNLSATKSVTEVTDDDVEAEIENLQYEYAEYNEVDRKSKDGDYVEVYMTASIDGEVVYDYSKEQDGYEILLGYNEFGKKFDKKLTGVSKSDKLSFTVDYKDDFEDESLAGQSVDYEVEVVGVQEEVIPELDEEFITETLGYESEEDMKTQVRKDLEETNDSDADYEVQEELMTQVIEASEFLDYTDEVYETSKESVESNYQYYAEMFGYTDADDIYEAFGMTDDDVESEIMDMVYRSIVISAIAGVEDLGVTDSEYDEQAEALAQDYGYDSVDDFAADYDESEINYLILEQKVLTFLEDNATITEETEQVDEGDGDVEVEGIE